MESHVESSVPNLFCHVASAIVSNEQNGGRRLSYQPRQASTLITREAVVELGPDESVVADRGKVDDWYHDSEEADNVEDQNKSFETREDPDENRVDEQRKQQDRIQNQRSLPSCWNI